MSPSNKKSTLEKRLKKVRKQLSTVDNSLKSLSRTLDVPGNPSAGGADTSARGGVRSDVTVDEGRLSGSLPVAPHSLPRDRSSAHDTRFISYLASGGLESGRPLRGEKHTQRNKAIVMSAFVLLLLVWVLFRFFLRP